METLNSAPEPENKGKSECQPESDPEAFPPYRQDERDSL
jgi:hypothetical protein